MLPIKYLFTNNNRATNGSIRSFFQVWECHEWTLVCSNPLPCGRPIICDWCLPYPVPRGGNLSQVLLNTALGGFKQIPPCNSLEGVSTKNANSEGHTYWLPRACGRWVLLIYRPSRRIVGHLQGVPKNKRSVFEELQNCDIMILLFTEDGSNYNKIKNKLS